MNFDPLASHNDYCIACGKKNDHGLKLKFEKLTNGEVQTSFSPSHLFDGHEGVLHGGIQALILDETLGKMARTAALVPDLFTAKLEIRYRAPVSSTCPITAQARLVKQNGDFFFLEAEITQQGSIKTKAEAVFKKLS